MTNKVLIIAIIFLFALFLPHSALSIESLGVVINEIAWMGTNTSYNDEWIVTTTEPFLYSQVLT